MKVPPGTSEYQASVRKAKDYLVRLSKGKRMLEEAVGNNQLVEAHKVIRLWDQIANQLYVELEIATLLHQHMLTGNQVLVRPNGTFVKLEELVETEGMELDPWTLLSMEKLKTVFGDDIHQLIHIEERLP